MALSKQRREEREESNGTLRTSIAHPRKPDDGVGDRTAEVGGRPRARPLPAAAPGAIALEARVDHVVGRMRARRSSETTRPVSGLAGNARKRKNRTSAGS